MFPLIFEVQNRRSGSVLKDSVYVLREQSTVRLYNTLHKLVFKYNLLCIINTLKLPLYKFILQDYIRNQLDKSLYLQTVCMKAMHNN